MHVWVQGAAGDVVDDVRAGRHALRRHLSVVRVHRDGDALQLLRLRQRPAQAPGKLCFAMCPTSAALGRLPNTLGLFSRAIENLPPFMWLAVHASAQDSSTVAACKLQIPP